MNLIEARLEDLEEFFDWNYPYHCMELMREMVMETTTVLNADFHPEEHFVYIRLPMVDYE